MSVWRKQKAIGWYKKLKGGISKRQKIAHGMYYDDNPDTREYKYFNDKVWIAGIIMSFIDFTLEL